MTSSPSTLKPSSSSKCGCTGQNRRATNSIAKDKLACPANERFYWATMSPPVVTLTIAGSDCGAGAGIQADLKTFSLYGIHGLTAISSVVVQTPQKVHSYHEVSPATLAEQIQILLDSYPVAAIKTGLLTTSFHISAVADVLAGSEIPLVVDPVLSASSGTDFGPQEVIQAYMEKLLPMASLATPNLPEAIRLLGLNNHLAPEELPPSKAAEELAEILEIPILLTGGHSVAENMVTDIFYRNGKAREFTHPWVDLPSTHGTGCTYSAAITSLLALGHGLEQAIPKAQSLMDHVLETSYRWPQEKGEQAISALNQLPPGPDGFCGNDKSEETHS